MTETKKERGGKDREMLVEFGKSFEFDRRLFFAAVRINLVYCDALFHAGIISRGEAERIKNGLQTLVKRAEFNRNFFDDATARNVHEFIEARLVQLIGDSGEKLNVGRSLIDQNATAFRLWLRGEIEELSKSLRVAQSILIAAGEKQKQAVLPVRAEAKKSQIVLWAHWCLAYFEMFERDRERLDENWRRVNILPLGAANLTGTAIEIDREEIAAALEFEGVAANSLDATRDADFAVETVGACSLIMTHLSRLAGDLISYNSAEFNFIEPTALFAFDDSASPANLDVLEVVRGKANRIFGNQTALLSMAKNPPLDIEKTLQETREIIFETIDTLKSCLRIIQIVLENIRLNEAVTETAAREYSSANELLDYLIFRGVSLKTSRATAEKIISYADSQNKKLNELSLEEMRRFSENISDDVFQALSLEQILASKNQIGGTAPERVFEALEAARESLRREEN